MTCFGNNMENRSVIKNYILLDNVDKLVDILNNGFDPNFENGWPIRLAARCGLYSIVKLFMRYGANPHLPSEAGASTLQLAVYSGEFWRTDNWDFLLSSCDSSQLADGAAVSIIFQNTAALKRILDTGRCDIHIPTSLTGKTVEQLAKGYRLQTFLQSPRIQNDPVVMSFSSPVNIRQSSSDYRTTLTPQPARRNLSPSVAKFFNQTANYSYLTPPRNINEGTFPSFSTEL